LKNWPQKKEKKNAKKKKTQTARTRKDSLQKKPRGDSIRSMKIGGEKKKDSSMCIAKPSGTAEEFEGADMTRLPKKST